MAFVRMNDIPTIQVLVSEMSFGICAIKYFLL